MTPKTIPELFAAYDEHLSAAIKAACGEGILPLGFFLGVKSLRAAAQAAIAAAPPTTATTGLPAPHLPPDAPGANARTSAAMMRIVLSKIDAAWSDKPIGVTGPGAEAFLVAIHEVEEVLDVVGRAEVPPTSAGATEEMAPSTGAAPLTTEERFDYIRRCVDGRDQDARTVMVKPSHLLWLFEEVARLTIAPASPPPPAREAETCTCGLDPRDMYWAAHAPSCPLSKPRTP